MNGLLLTKQNVISGGGASKFEVTPSMLASMTKHSLYQEKNSPPSQ